MILVAILIWVLVLIVAFIVGLLDRSGLDDY